MKRSRIRVWGVMDNFNGTTILFTVHSRNAARALQSLRDAGAPLQIVPSISRGTNSCLSIAVFWLLAGAVAWITWQLSLVFG